MRLGEGWRRSIQPLMPAEPGRPPRGQYNIYPGFPVGSGRIGLGYNALAARLAQEGCVVIDGYPGVLWEHFIERLDASLRQTGVKATWRKVATALLPSTAIERLVTPWLGGDDPLFGRRFQGELGDFFDPERLKALGPEAGASLNILYGCGAALAGWRGLLVYLDVPKNEIQFRSRAGSVHNLGSYSMHDPKATYKRCYFVDWVAANKHKAELLERIDLIVDEQRPEEPTFMTGDDLRAGLTTMSRSCWRVRPWFEPGPWGGQWIKEHIPQLPQEPPNYAWSFELIVPENGLVFESDGRCLEVSFDFLMYQDAEAVLGACAGRFGHEFPIRFDFLDTFGGGNLSVQCHPRPDYMRRHFGERFTQDETYYTLDCRAGAQVYLGFQAGVDREAFRRSLERSQAEGSAIDVEQFVSSVPARKHDLFLIPNGTIHCSGTDNLVLEISATPYIFTFKMYDWMRLDLDGRPRPLNLERAFENLNFERQGERVQRELVAGRRVLEEAPGARLVHLPTHAEHFYDVHRLDFTRPVEVRTDNVCHVMNLVEGRSVMLETASGERQSFNYAETFAVPAAAEWYRLRSEDGSACKVVKAFVKPEAEWMPGAVL